MKMNPELEVGDRIVLLALSGEDLIAGIKGTVTRKSFVIDQIQYSMDWDNGSKLALLANEDKYMLLKDLEDRKAKKRGNITEMDAKVIHDNREIFENFNMNLLWKYYKALQKSGITNMLQSSQYFYLGKERIAHEFHYKETNEHFDDVLEMADEVKNNLISGVMKIMDKKNGDYDISRISSMVNRYSSKIVSLIVKIYL
jgi:signal peptidase I